MTADIDRDKLRELCEQATPGPWESTVCDDGLMMVATTGDTICFGDPNHKEPDDTANGDFIAAARTALPALLDLTDAQAAKTAELEAENALSRTKIEKMICQQEGAVCIENYYDLLKEFDIPCITHTPECDTFISPFDALVGWKREAGARIASLEAERDQLRKQVEGQFVAGMQKAETDVIAERRRQVEQEGWTPEHDARHAAGDLADAAACYASTDRDLRHGVPFGWPWSAAWWKPTDRRRDLVKAGALIIAEIERLDRVSILSAASALEQKEQG